MIDDDLFLSFLVLQKLAINGFELALAGPFRVRVVDRSPSDTGLLREQDWDDPSDFMRIVPYLSFQHTGSDGYLDLYAGQLNGAGIGHGALADHYFNSTDMDHYRAGPLLQGEWSGNGLEFIMDDFISPNLTVGRVHLAPFAWFFEGKWSRRFEIGYSIGADFNAPLQEYGGGDTLFLATGGDLSLIIIERPWGTTMPYLDIIFMDGDLGLHTGLDTFWRLSKDRKLMLFFQGEYRFVGPDYHPAVFNPFYDQNRRFYPVTPDDALTFADHLRNSDDLPSGHGFMFDCALQWDDKLRLGARYDTEGLGRRHWILFRVSLTPTEGYHLSGFYAGQDIRGGSGIFSADTLIGVALRGRVYGPLDLFFHFTRRLRRQGSALRSANEAGGGIGISLTY